MLYIRMEDGQQYKGVSYEVLVKAMMCSPHVEEETMKEYIKSVLERIPAYAGVNPPSFEMKPRDFIEYLESLNILTLTKEEPKVINLTDFFKQSRMGVQY